jgi:hypothetical protein
MNADDSASSYSDANCQTYVSTVHPTPDYTPIDAPIGVLGAKWVDTTDSAATAAGFSCKFCHATIGSLGLLSNALKLGLLS